MTAQLAPDSPRHDVCSLNRRGEELRGAMACPGRRPIRDLRLLVSIVLDELEDGRSELVRAVRCRRVPGPRARLLLRVLAGLPREDQPPELLYWIERASAMVGGDQLAPLVKCAPSPARAMKPAPLEDAEGRGARGSSPRGATK